MTGLIVETLSRLGRRTRTAFALAAAMILAAPGPAKPWGEDGHSVVAEIAQQRLSPEARAMVSRLIGNRSLASVASYADDIRDARPDTANWHFVDIPIHSDDYKPERDCKDDTRGDCVVKELERLKTELRCAPGAQQREALKLAVHFVGDIHQPLHTVLEARGGNDIPVAVQTRGRKTCSGECKPPAANRTNFHAAWDVDLIQATVWDWGAYVDLLEAGWLAGAEARQAGIDGGTPADWAVETHKAAQKIWKALPAGQPLDDAYYAEIAPVLDRQLGLAGLRLAHMLNTAFASADCSKTPD